MSACALQPEMLPYLSHGTPLSHTGSRVQGPCGEPLTTDCYAPRCVVWASAKARGPVTTSCSMYLGG
jgi:hypothetical protein